MPEVRFNGNKAHELQKTVFRFEFTSWSAIAGFWKTIPLHKVRL
jgi:hypothetical protein